MAFVSKIYANTLASYNEKYLMDADRLRRLMDCSYPDAIKALMDYGWGDGQATPTQESLLAYETSKLISFVRENAVSDKVRDVLLAEFMFHNAKASYKGRVSGRDVKRALYGGFEDVSEAVMEKEYSALPDILADCLTSLDEKGDVTELSPREIDMAVSRARYEYSLRKARGDRSLTKYVKSEIDLKNLLTLFRCRVMEMEASDFSEMFIEGGSLDESEMVKALTGTAEAFNLFYARCQYYEVFAGVEKGESAITELETGIDNYLYALTLAGREDFTSKNPFINYFYRALIELKTVKTVLVCIKNNAVGEIKRRLRAIYD
ncbi:MAG: V-type ATPase subunit [Clostridia bacterium]|nr:V-type ATPase subunit [Clostridia bacterium]